MYLSQFYDIGLSYYIPKVHELTVFYIMTLWEGSAVAQYWLAKQIFKGPLHL